MNQNLHLKHRHINAIVQEFHFIKRMKKSQIQFSPYKCFIHHSRSLTISKIPQNKRQCHLTEKQKSNNLNIRQHSNSVHLAKINNNDTAIYYELNSKRNKASFIHDPVKE